MYIVVFWYFRYKYLVYTRYLNFWYIPKIPRPIPTSVGILGVFSSACDKLSDITVKLDMGKMKECKISIASVLLLFQRRVINKSSERRYHVGWLIFEQNAWMKFRVADRDATTPRRHATWRCPGLSETEKILRSHSPSLSFLSFASFSFLSLALLSVPWNEVEGGCNAHFPTAAEKGT